MHELNRRSLLLAGAAALIGADVAAARGRARGDGFETIPYLPMDAIPYFQPGVELDRHWRQIDPLIRPAVRAINRSGWVWTAESCQGGHEFSDTPMLRLVVREADVGDLLAAVYDAMIVGTGSDASVDSHVTLERHAPAPEGWTEFRIWNASHYSQRRSIAYFARLANRL